MFLLMLEDSKCFSIESLLLHCILAQTIFSLFQVNFSYIEAGEQKQALVKLVACKRLVNPLFRNRIFMNPVLGSNAFRLACNLFY